jgi:hypothetical protein
MAYDEQIFRECVRQVYLEEVDRLVKVLNSNETAVAKKIRITEKNADRTLRRFQSGTTPNISHVVQLANFMHEPPSRLFERIESLYRTHGPELMKKRTVLKSVK